MVKVEFYVFLALLSVSSILLIAAVSTDHWVEFGIDGKSYQGLWNLCYRFSRTKTTVCSGLDKISELMHAARALIIVAVTGYMFVFLLVYLMKIRILKTARLLAIVSFLVFFSEMLGMAFFTADAHKVAGQLSVRFAVSYYLGWFAVGFNFSGIVISLNDIVRVRNSEEPS